jgi:hypothetical protein
VAQHADSTFAFNEAGLGLYFVNVLQGTRIAEFGLFGAVQDSPAVDLDLCVYARPQFSCTQVGSGKMVALMNQFCWLTHFHLLI